MQINKENLIRHELVHFYDSLSGDYIVSTGNAFEFSLNNQKFNFKIKSRNPFIKLRIFRRLLRLDKSNAFFNFQKTLVIVIYQGIIFSFSTQISLRLCKHFIDLKSFSIAIIELAP